jgi:ribonuclease HI
MVKRKPEFATCYVDGASRGNPGPSGIGVVVRNSKGETIAEVKEYIGEGTNNVAEYQSVIRALKELKKLNISGAVINIDSELIVNQLNGNYRIKNQVLFGLAKSIRQLEKDFSFVNFSYIPREKNKVADKLANVAINLVI